MFVLSTCKVAVKDFKSKDKLDKEYKFLRQTTHPNIVTCYGKTDSALILEHCPYSLSDILAKSPANITSNMGQIALGIARSLEYLHKKDVAPKNILLTEEFVPKLIDLELSATFVPIEYCFGMPLD